MTALLIRRRRPVGEPDHAAAEAGSEAGSSRIVQVMAGTAGAGRICAALLQHGLRLEGVHQAVVEPEASPADLAAVDVGDRFGVVVLGSHLVNLPEAERRSAFVRLAGRHLADSGRLFVEQHPIDWAETAADVEPTPGSALGMSNVRRDPPFVSAVSVYDAFGRVFRQPFTARVLSDAELAAVLHECGLAVARRLGPTWVEAKRVGGGPPSGVVAHG